jgi:pimeloyl-ACP methyl ester carboxylesterase
VRSRVSSQHRSPPLALEQTGAGPALVLIHGLATTRAIWSPVVPRLGERRRVIALDVPGFGDSPPAGPGFALEQVAHRIGAGLASAGVPTPYDLVGHSLGGALALTLAVRRPADVRRLVLVAPAGLAPLPSSLVRVLAAGASGVLTARRTLAPLTDLSWGRRLLLAFAAADGGELPPTAARLLVEASDGARRTNEAFATVACADLRPLLARTRAPLGVIWGAADRTLPARAVEEIERERPDALIVLIEGVGHVLMAERPAEFARTLDALLERLPQAATSLAAAPPTLP